MELSIHLTNLTCSHNKLTSLPELPDGLLVLSCDNNQLTTLPELPTSLLFLECGNNQLTTLPNLPINMRRLNCGQNPLVDPFPEWLEDYYETSNISHLRKRVKSFWEKKKLRELGRNIQSLMLTLGKDETLNMDCLSVVSEYLTGERGSIHQQAARLMVKVTT